MTNAITKLKNRLRYRYFYQSLNVILHFYGFFTRYKKINLSALHSPKCVNLGSGLKVAQGWTNLDFNIPSLFCRLPNSGLRILFRYLKEIKYSEIQNKRFCIQEESYVDIIINNKFICHNLLYGIPLKSSSVDYIYSSHMIGFSFPEKYSIKLLREIKRTLRPGGILRLSIVDGDIYWKTRTRTLPIPKYCSDANCFSFIQIADILKEIGFVDIRRYSYKIGTVPDINILDDYSSQIDTQNNSGTLYLEATKN
jgi:SAM-dependent methyltransferase